MKSTASTPVRGVCSTSWAMSWTCLRSLLDREGKSGVAKSGVVLNRSEGYLCVKKPCQLVMAGVRHVRVSKSLSNSAGGVLSKMKGDSSKIRQSEAINCKEYE